MAVVDEATHWAQVDQTGGPEACWPWTGKTFHNSGYGQAQGDKRPMCAHRLSWILTNGPLPTYISPEDGHTATYRIAHNCPIVEGGVNKVCCNPAHIMLLTKAQDIEHRATHDR